MKKLLALLLSLSIIISSVSAVSALDIELPKNLEEFTSDVSELINEYDELNSNENAVFFTADDETENDNTYGTNRLIVKSSKKVDPLNSVKCVSGYNDLYILQFENDADCDAALEYYSSLSCVEYVQEDGILTETAVEEAEDTVSEAAVGISSQYQSDLFGYTNAKANMGSSPVTIAVVDTGVQNDHEYLAGRVIPTGFDSVNNESCYDKRGHGTHVAGIIVANTKSNVKIKPYKVIGDDGTGTDTQLYLGIQAAIEDGVDIINLSLTRKGESEVVHEAVKNAYNAGITVVAAAGNDNVNLDETPYIPACFPEVICVVSIDTNKKRASTSNWRFEDTLSAPGVDILSSYLDNTYKIMSGTSMAAPFISCCAAYLLANGDYHTPASIYTTLHNNTQQGATASIHYVVPGELIAVKNTCITPVFTYSSGEFSGYLDVLITCATPGATIMYRTSDMNSKTYYEYTGPIRIEKTTTISAYAFCKNYKASSSATVTYTKSDFDTSDFEIDENGVLVGYTGTQASVTVPDFLDGRSVTSVDASAFSGNTALTSVSFAKYVTTIGEGAFKGCTGLMSVSASGCTDIEAEAFSGCASLKSVSIPAVVTIDSKAFSGCSALTKASFSKLITLSARAFENSGITTFSASKLTTIGDYAFSGTPINSASFTYVTAIGSNAFENCKSLTSISFPKVTLMGNNCFSGCDNLKSASFNSLTFVPANMFKNCVSLTTARFPSVTDVNEYAFYGCSALTTIDFSKATTIGDYAFYGCSDITSFDFTSVTDIGNYSFAETSINSILLPNAVTNIGEKAFNNCSEVLSIELPASTSFDTVDFLGIPNVETLVVPKVTEFAFNGGTFAEVFPNIKTFDNNMGVDEIADGFFDGCSHLESVAFQYYTYGIGANAFRGTALKEAVFDEARTFGDGCFSDIPTLEKVHLRRFSKDNDFSVFSGSENIKSMYLLNLTALPDGFRCSELFPHIIFFDSAVTDVPEYAFKDCDELTYYSFTFTESIGVEAFMGTSVNDVNCLNVTAIGDGAFKDCTNLGVVKLPKLKDIDLNVFENSEATVTELNLSGVSEITEEDAETFNFSKFISLKTVNLNSLTVLPARTFKECPALTDITLNNCTKVCEEAFAYCTSLADIKLNSATAIEKNAFLYCASLQNFEADSVTAFDFSTFDGCTNLKSLSFNSLTEISVDENGKLDINNLDNLESFSADALKVVPDNFFKDCEKLTTVSFVNATKVGNYAFYNTALSKFTLTNLKTVGDYAFYGTDVADVELPSVTRVGEYAFAGCDSLKEISLKSLITLPLSALKDSTAISIIRLNGIKELPVGDDGSTYVSDKPLISQFYGDRVTEIPDSYFEGKDHLYSVSFDSVTKIGNRAFMNTALSDIITFGVVEIIGDYAFYNAPVFSTAIFDCATEIGDYAFYGTKVTDLDTFCIEKIGDYAFANCPYLDNAVIYNDDYYNDGVGVIELGKGVFENDTGLTRAVLMFEDVELPDFFFKNCTKLKTLLVNDVSRNPQPKDYADIKSVGEEAFYGCTAMSFSKLKLTEIEHIGKNALAGVTNAYSSDNFNLDLPNLISADEGAFGNMYYDSVTFENAEILKDVPDCNYVVIGSDIKEFSCEDTDTIMCAYEDSVVDEFCTANGLNFKKYDGKENIFYDVDPILTGYDYYLYFDAIGFDCTYEWYACNNPDRSDAVLIETTLEDPQTIDPIRLFVEDFEENKYTYFYCVATSTENGNVLKIQSQLCKNIFATIRGTDDTLIDFIECGIFTHSLDNINTLDNIFTVDGDIRVTPSYSTDTEDCYGSGTIVEIQNGDETALGLTIVVYGDINGDGVVDALDVSRIEKESSGNSEEFTEYAFQAAADIDGSGSIDAVDYQAVVNKALAS